jgi:hypothetical protein
MNVELTEREASLVRTALRSFADDFGHEEAEVHREVLAVLAKLEAGADAGASGSLSAD